MSENTHRIYKVSKSTGKRVFMGSASAAGAIDRAQELQHRPQNQGQRMIIEAVNKP